MLKIRFFGQMVALSIAAAALIILAFAVAENPSLMVAGEAGVKLQKRVRV